VLAKGRGWRWRRSWGPSEFDRPLHRAIAPDLRMVEGRDEILGEHLRVLEHVLDRTHRGARHALAKELFPFKRSARGAAMPRPRDRVRQAFRQSPPRPRGLE